MKKISATVLVALAVILGFTVWVHFHDAAVRAEMRQAVIDARVDSAIAVVKQEAADSLKAFQRQQDSTGRAIRLLRQRVARQTSPVATASGGTNSPAVAPSLMIPDSDLVSQLALRDSLIAALEAGREQDSLQILFWRGQTAQRDTLLERVQASRNTWRSRSQRRFSCGVGAAVTVGLDGRAAVGPSVGCFIRL